MRNIILSLFSCAIPLSVFCQSLPFNPLFDESKVNSVYIEMNSDSLAELYINIESDHEYNVTFIYDYGTSKDTLKDVGFRLRGNTSRYAVKKSFKVSFNTFVPGRKYQNIEKVNLNGSHNDPSMVREKLFYDVWNQFNLASRRSSFVKVYINDDYYGLYTNIEEIDEIWCKDRFGDNTGNLYKCTYPADLDYINNDPDSYKEISSGTVSGGRAYDLQTNEEADNYSDLTDLITILEQTPVSDLPCKLEKIFNVDAFLRAFAMDVSTGNWDDYMYNKNNFFLYHNLFTNQFEFITYDTDNSFGVDWLGIDWSTRYTYEWQLMNQPRPLATRILQVPEYRDRFTYYLDQLVNTVLFPDSIELHIDSMKDLITPAAIDDLYRTYDYGYSISDFYNSFNTNNIDGHTPYGINNFIELRRTNTLDQLIVNDISPVLTGEHHLPSIPAAGDSIDIMVHASDDGTVNTVNIYYSFDSLSFTQTLMHDDGFHNDESAADGIYGIRLSPSVSNGFIYYYFEATDNGNITSRFPICDDFKYKIGFVPPQLFINEFMASNQTTITDNPGEYDDYVELYNAGSNPVYLGDKYLTDDLTDPSKWQLPNVTLDPDEYILFWMDNSTQQGYYHASFSLNAAGEQIGLFSSVSDFFAPIDTFTFPQQSADVSMGRLPNGVGAFIVLSGPTPGYSNYSVGVTELTSQNYLQVISNPSSNEIIFQLTIDDPAVVLLQIYSMDGVMVKTINLSTLSKGVHTVLVNAMSFPSNIYFVKAILNGKPAVKKFVIQ